MKERRYAQKTVVKYRGIHMWASRHMPVVNCDDCGTKKGTLHHANISGKYKRDLDDWKILCVPCHSEFDGNNKIPLSQNKEIIRLRESGMSFQKIADLYAVSRKCISKRFYRITRKI